MITVSSISGGKSSCYMALRFPTDKYVFAPVLSNDPACIIQDKKLRDYCKRKVPNFNWDEGGSRELDLTLLNLMKLEEELGHEVDWVSAPFTFEEMCQGITSPVAKCFGRPLSSKPRLPNRVARICTQSLKVYPIFWHLFVESDEEPVLMNIGFRADEKQRVEKWTCKNDNIRITLHCDIEGRYKTCHRYQLSDWRITTFPLVEYNICHQEIKAFWKDKGWIFPSVSNCDFCFFHQQSELRQQYLRDPERARLWCSLETEAKASFGKAKLNKILNPQQLELFDKETILSCFCSD